MKIRSAFATLPLLAAILFARPASADQKNHRFDGGPEKIKTDCPMMKDGKPCDDACMKQCAEQGGCKLHEHGDKGCPMMKDGKPCDEACRKACTEKGGCPLHGGHDGAMMHGDKGCPMMKDGKPCDEGCMKHCAEKGGCGMHEHGGCPMMKDGKPCDEGCMKHCAEKGGCGLQGDDDCPMMKDGKPCERDCPMHGATDRPEDRAAITATALDYAEGWYAGDGERMGRALHPALAKRMVYTDEKGASVLHQMDKEKLVAGTKAGGGGKTPPEQRKKDVRILDLYGNAGVVKLTMSGWVDYLEVAKFDGRWVIVNVLWERNPKPPAAASAEPPKK